MISEDGVDEQPMPLGEPMPAGVVVVCVVEVVLYLDGEGEEKYRLRYEGRPSNIVGLLGLAQHDVIGNRNRREGR